MDKSIFYPMLAMVALTFSVIIVLARRRFGAVKAGQFSELKYFKTFQGAIEPDHVRVAQRNLSNLFELPVLFYAGCLATAIFGAVDMVSLVAAWAYVALRIAHTIVHLGGNHVPTRFRLFFLSCVPLAVLWLNIAL